MGADEFDYIVVGAGSAGCVLAARLSEDPSTRVLLLEAGGADRHPYVHIPAAFPRLFGSRRDWGYETVPQEGLGGRRVYHPRGKLLGGSSSINAMMWIRGFRADYDAWAELAGPEWSYDQLLPYFARAESGPADDGVYGSDGPLAVSHQRAPHELTRRWLQAGESLGMAVGAVPNSGADDGLFLARVTQRAGRRTSAADAYLRPARRRPNLVVATYARCLGFVVEGGQVRAVRYRARRRLHTVRAAREVLCCAGAINTPQLLACSGLGPADELVRLGIEVHADLPEVGKNLADHLTAGFVAATPGTRTLAQADRPRALYDYLAHRRGLLSSNLAEGYGYLHSQPGLSAPDLELLFVPGPFVDEGRRQERRDAVTFAAVLLQPESTGEVRIVSADPTVAPALDPRYLTDAARADARRLRVGVQACLELAGTPAFKDLLGEYLQPTGLAGDALVDASVYGLSQTLYHPAGTARMGRDEASVVDEHLRVRQVRGLRVVDASVMPRMVRAHTHAPTVMLAEKAADLLRAGG